MKKIVSFTSEVTEQLSKWQDPDMEKLKIAPFSEKLAFLSSLFEFMRNSESSDRPIAVSFLDQLKKERTVRETFSSNPTSFLGRFKLEFESAQSYDVKSIPLHLVFNIASVFSDLGEETYSLLRRTGVEYDGQGLHWEDCNPIGLCGGHSLLWLFTEGTYSKEESMATVTLVQNVYKLDLQGSDSYFSPQILKGEKFKCKEQIIGHFSLFEPSETSKFDNLINSINTLFSEIPPGSKFLFFFYNEAGAHFIGVKSNLNGEIKIFDPELNKPIPTQTKREFCETLNAWHSLFGKDKETQLPYNRFQVIQYIPL